MRRLAAVVERRVHDALLEEDRVARAERGRVALDVLRDLALLDDDHLLLARMLVEIVSLAGLERDVHDHEVTRALVRREPPADRAPVEAFLPHVGLLDEAAHRFLLS